MRSNLTLARRRRKLSQVALAEAVGANQSTVAKWERGTAAPSAATLLRLAAILRRSPAHLLADDGQQPAPRPRRARTTAPAEVSP